MTLTTLPPALAPLAAYRQFILWRLQPSTTRPGAMDKLPIHPETLVVHNAQDPAIHLDAPTALRLAAAHTVGVGFVFTANDPFFFLDIDKCLLPTNQWSPLALELCTALSGAAVEVSQSGKGLHIIGTGLTQAHSSRAQAHGLELYSSGRFVALTGAQTTGRADFNAPGINNVAARYFPANAIAPDSADWTTGPCPEWKGPLDDEELVARMLKSSSASATFGGRASIQALWAGDADALEASYPDTGGTRPFDHSAADAALCQHLAFWTGKDCERIDRLFRRSALCRDKWTERSDYRQRTILRAVGLCKTVYGTKTAAAAIAPTPADADPSTYRAGTQYLPVTQQLEHFKGCVYVRNLHRVLVPDGELLKPDQFKATYGGYVFALDSMNNKTTKNAWEVFTESQATQFPRVEGTCFRPELPPAEVVQEEGRRLVNTYVPITTARTTGDVTPFLNHVSRILPVAHDRAIFLSYLAACVQSVGVKFQWTPLLQGCEGNGKTVFINCLAHAVGHRYTHLPNASDMGGNGSKFNSWIQNKLFIGVEEVYVSDRREVLDALKPLITNHRIEIQGKGVDQITGDNRANFVMCSNHKDAILKTRNDRRFCVFFTAQQTAADIVRDGMGGEYFPNLYKWLKSGGYAVVSDYLARYTIPKELDPAHACHRAPETSSIGEVLAASLGSLEQEILEAIDEGRPGFAGGWVSSMALDRLINEHREFKRTPRNRRKEILENLGYQRHPALKNGRASRVIPSDGGQPRLYIMVGHLSAGLATSAAAMDAYMKAQDPATAAVGASFGAVAPGGDQ